MFSWIKEKWKIVVGAFIFALTALSLLLRARDQKRVLSKANESHKKDVEIGKHALDSAIQGMTQISNETEGKIKEALDESEKDQLSLKKEKDEFIESSSKSENLAKEIADHIGAKHVKD